MSWGSPFFVIAIIAVSTVGWLVNNWIRAKHGYSLEDEWGGKTEKNGLDATRKVELLTNENEQLNGKIGRLEERLAVLERIATDRESSSARLSDEIEKLR
ncbi:hypothetical protein ACR9YC_05330 [Parasphingorhabdus sp. DH2-15]|uniref:hypothetical protein n=1 Tax=Parasphingorhabdus sp. DH2-15 TaxID=3444112 RepID=UPI003F688320